MRSPRSRADRSRAERGSAVVDFVLVSLVLVPLVLGIIQVALVMQVRTTLAAAATEGARYAATVDRDPAAGVTRAKAQVEGALAARFASDITAREEYVGGLRTIVVRMHAVVPPLGLWGPGVRIDVSGHGVEEAP